MKITRQQVMAKCINEAKFKTKNTNLNQVKINISKDTLKKLKKLTNVK